MKGWWARKKGFDRTHQLEDKSNWSAKCHQYQHSQCRNKLKKCKCPCHTVTQKGSTNG